ncbi:MAG: gluconate:H+ symporter, partial [Cyclobacteriaceae bacterium]
MLDYQLILAVIGGVAVLLGLILYVRLQAFIALLIASIFVGIFAGMPPLTIISTIQQGMASTLGFVAVVVGLGAIFGAILEHSGGAQALAQFLISKFGEKRASWALVLTGFFVAIPVFFDVGFIILVPLIYALQRKTSKSLLLYAMPLLAGLAITHAFIPPTPGPVAVADILNADLGWVILFGVIAGVPAAIVSGPIFAKYISRKIHLEAPALSDGEIQTSNPPPVAGILAIIGLPILLILANTLLGSPLVPKGFIPVELLEIIQMIGHPFSALIIANLIAWYTLGIRRGFTRSQLQDISTKSLAPAGIIILLTGAGGVFKQILVNTGTGEMLASYFAQGGVNIMLFAFI